MKSFIYYSFFFLAFVRFVHAESTETLPIFHVLPESSALHQECLHNYDQGCQELNRRFSDIAVLFHIKKHRIYAEKESVSTSFSQLQQVQEITALTQELSEQRLMRALFACCEEIIRNRNKMSALSEQEINMLCGQSFVNVSTISEQDALKHASQEAVAYFHKTTKK